MKGRANIVSAVHHLKMAEMNMVSYMKEKEHTVFERLFNSYIGKIRWMFNDMKSEPLVPQIVRDGINQELNSDVLAVPAIVEKIHLLPPSKREAIESLIDEMLKEENKK